MTGTAIHAPTTFPIEDLPQQLAAELADLECFSLLLAKEQQVLKDGDVDHLPELVQQKSALATRLGERLAVRERVLVSAGYPRGREGMEAWLAKRSQQGSEHTQWRQLLALAEKTRNEHAINGKLIALHLQRNQQALTALMSASGQVLTYGPDGQHRMGGAGRNFGSA